MFASSIDSVLLYERDNYADEYYTAERVSPNIVSLRCKSDQCEILRARCVGEDDWEALPCDREMTEYETHDIIALKENLMKVLEGLYWEQQRRVDIVAPIVVAMLKVKKTNHPSLNRYTAEWKSPLLTLRETGNPVPIMKAEWNGEVKRWREQDSKLTAETTSYFLEKVEPLVQSLIKRERPPQVHIDKSKPKNRGWER